MIKSETIELITKSIPYPTQIEAWDIESETGAVRFTWRSTRFRVSVPGTSVEEVGDGVLISSDLSILLEWLLKINKKT